MRPVTDEHGGVFYQLDHETALFLQAFQISLRNQGIYDAPIAAQAIVDQTKLKIEMNLLRDKLTTLEGQVQPVNLAEIREQLGDLTDRINNFNPNFGAF